MGSAGRVLIQHMFIQANDPVHSYFRVIFKDDKFLSITNFGGYNLIMDQLGIIIFVEETNIYFFLPDGKMFDVIVICTAYGLIFFHTFTTIDCQ